MIKPLKAQNMLFPCTLYYYTLRFGTIIHLNVYLHSFVTLFPFSNSLKTKIARAQLRHRRRGRVARLLSNHFPWGFLSRVRIVCWCGAVARQVAVGANPQVTLSQFTALGVPHPVLQMR